MDRSEIVTLIGVTYQVDAIGQRIPQEARREVFCQVSSVTASEFFEAGRAGLQAQLRVVMFAPEYADEKTVEYKGKRYGVYRTYLAKDEMLELYLERKVGA